MSQDESPQSDWARLKILSETKWYRVYESETGVPVTVSKFVTDKIELSESVLRNEWASWAPGDKVLFAQAFVQKPSFTAEDRPIFDFLMAVDNPAYVQVVIAPALPRHPDRKRAIAVLVESLESTSGRRANTIKGLLNIAATDSAAQPEIVAALKRFHSRLLPLAHASAPSPEDATSQPKNEIMIILDFIACSGALAYLENSSVYLDQIRPFSSHPNRAIAFAAASYLAYVQQASEKPSTNHPDERE